MIHARLAHHFTGIIYSFGEKRQRIRLPVSRKMYGMPPDVGVSCTRKWRKGGHRRSRADARTEVTQARHRDGAGVGR